LGGVECGRERRVPGGGGALREGGKCAGEREGSQGRMSGGIVIERGGGVGGGDGSAVSTGV